jgi:hypothetical protein
VLDDDYGNSYADFEGLFRAFENGYVLFSGGVGLRVFAQRWGILTSQQTLEAPHYPSQAGLPCWGSPLLGLPRFHSLLLMTLDALKRRYVAKINRVLERLVSFVAIIALVVGE